LHVVANVRIELVISLVVPFPISFVIALLVFFLLNAVRMHIALKRQGVACGIKELYKSIYSSFGNSRINNGLFGGSGLAYSPIK
jgi:hypothetical protein